MSTGDFPSPFVPPWRMPRWANRMSHRLVLAADARMRSRAREIGHAMENENGVANGVKRIEALVRAAASRE